MITAANDAWDAGWGNPDLDGEPVPGPPTEPCSAPPPRRVQAWGAPTSSWIQLLAAYAGRNLLFPSACDGRIEVDLEGVPFDEALRRSATQAGAELIEEGRLVLWPREVRSSQQAVSGPRRALELPGGGVLEVVLEGVVLVEPDSDDRDSCLIGGLIYRQGDMLLDETSDEEAPVEVAAIEADHLVLRLVQTGAEVALPSET